MMPTKVLKQKEGNLGVAIPRFLNDNTDDLIFGGTIINWQNRFPKQ